MSISQAAGAFANDAATNLATLAVTNATVGDYRIISVAVSAIPYAATGVSGGGVTNWGLIGQGHDATKNYSLFGGIVTATGAQTITVTYNFSTGVTNELWSSELVWSGGVAPAWKVVLVGIKNNASSTTVQFPTLLSAGPADQAYWGMASCQNPATVGSTSGFTYSTVNFNGNLAVFNGTLSANTSYQPLATESPAGTSGAIACIIQATANVPPEIITRVAVQRASFR